MEACDDASATCGKPTHSGAAPEEETETSKP